ncbi:MAG TPA: redoxin domain-containing protein [Longimicrobium sp.]|jgi:thiol-disulfide isomerase/thioredoxin
MKRHPTSATLSRYLDGELGSFRRRRVAAHLAECPACGEEVQAWASIGDALRDAPVPALGGCTLGRVRELRAAGERRILPVPTARAPRMAMRAAAAAAVVVLAAGAVMAVRHTPELAAEGSTLLLSPAAPRAGQEVRVEYRAAGKLAGEKRLVLRARLFGSSTERTGATHTVVAELASARGAIYRGVFRLPDSVAYAALAVEDERGDRVDYNPSEWEVVVHGAGGKPLLAALDRKAEHRGEWDSGLALETAREMARLYPDSTRSWLARYAREREMLDQVRGDSLTAAYRQRFRALEAARLSAGGVAPEEMLNLANLASMLDDSVGVERWVGRLIAEAPAHPYAIGARVERARERHRGDPRATLAELERLWSEGGGAVTGLAFAGVVTARAAGDPAAVLRWAERLERTEPSWDPFVARTLSEIPSLRAEAAVRLRRQIRRLEADANESRPLGHTRADHRVMRGRARAYFLGQLGRSLLAAGHTASALDTLSHAVEAGWNLEIFRTIADTRLALGDTAGALPLLARVAADPSTPATFTDSVRARTGRHFAALRWPAMVGEGREALDAYVWSHSESRGVRGEVHLTDLEGRRSRFRTAGDGPTLVAFWSRECPPSVAQLKLLDRVAGELRTRGVRVLAITDEPSPAPLRQYLRDAGYSFPVFLDTDGDAARGFDNRATPRYFVLDARGRIRFDNYAPDDVIRQAVALRGRR